MDTLHFSIDINAPAKKVWQVMLQDKTYREWTKNFNPEGGSYFEGSWDKGAKIRFIGPSANGTLGGMVATIADNRPYEFVSVKHLGLITPDGGEDLTSEEAKAWSGGYENYTLTEKEGVTTVDVDLGGGNIPQQFIKMFEDMWPKGLARLKELAEK